MKNIINRRSVIGNVLFMLTFFLMSCQAPGGVTILNAIEFDQSMKKAGSENFVLLDVRTPEEYQEGHLQNALNIDYNNPGFSSNIKSLDKKKTVYVYCRSGRRSADAASIMRSNGFTNVIELQGGILAWEDSHLPIIK